MISASSNVIAQGSTPPTGQQTALEDFRHLAQDLRSGNLSGAQSVYSALAKNAPPAATDTSTPLGLAFQKLGQALQSGDVAGATQALRAVTANLRTHQRHIPLSNSGEPASPATESNGDSDSSSGGLNATA